ncbi:MAG: biotin/lipoyl-binding protein [Armatimonadetes bacterium]|nr:biotin/lipoyl-binding protein [Armatimonadota bacterium]
MNFDALTEVLNLLGPTRVAELEIEAEGGNLLRLRRTPMPVAPAAAPAAVSLEPSEVAAEPSGPPLTRVEALFVGRFHLPQKPVAEGDTVEEDQILGAVESLGLMNAVSAPKGGRIAAVHVEDGEPVEYGQLLFEIE